MTSSRLISVLTALLAAICVLIWFFGADLQIGGHHPLLLPSDRVVLMLAMVFTAGVVLLLSHFLPEQAQGTGQMPSPTSEAVRSAALEVLSPDFEAGRTEATDPTVDRSRWRNVPTGSLGCIGHSPAQRGRICVNLPYLFSTVWEDWTHELLRQGEAVFERQWSVRYRDSGGCRFVWSPGIAGDATWAGVMVPSANSIGDPRPFCIAASLPDDTPPTDAITALADWFLALEDAAVEIVEETIDTAAIAQRLQQLVDLPVSLPVSAPDPAAREGEWQPGEPMAIRLPLQARSGRAMIDGVDRLDQLMYRTFCQYSVWIRSPRAQQRADSALVSSALPLGRQGLSLVSRESALAGLPVEERLSTLHELASEVTTRRDGLATNVDTLPAGATPSATPQRQTPPVTSANCDASHTRLIRPGTAESRDAAAVDGTTQPRKS